MSNFNIESNTLEVTIETRSNRTQAKTILYRETFQTKSPKNIDINSSENMKLIPKVQQSMGNSNNLMQMNG